ncbi:phage baseplate assembly protein [Acinetobacter indicus]|uniref:phage baseplate assembly protein n=1 Tax=Acinetobacter indicus TaxID=756892 RepID=UPI0032B55569
MQDKPVRLIVAGYEINTWDMASIDSAIDTPADSWSFALFDEEDHVLPKEVRKNAAVQFYYGNELILTSVVDKVSEKVDRSGYALAISGRDLAGQLIDCSVPVFNGRQMTLDELVNKFVLGGDLKSLFKGVNIQDKAWLKNKVSVEPGESIWDALVKAAAVTGQHIWHEPDGSLTIGDPFKNAYQVSTPLRLFKYDDDNNVLNADYVEDGSNEYSDFKILGQDGDAQNISSTSESGTDSHRRLKIITMADVETKAEADTAINKIKKDSDLQTYAMQATVAGWTIDNMTWAAGFHLNFETNRLNRATAKWAVTGRTLTLSRKDGKLTQLRLNRHGDWAQPLVHKEKNK